MPHGLPVSLTELMLEPSNSITQITELFIRLNANLFLSFSIKMNGKRKLNVPAGGVVTFGSTPPPIPLYQGPVDRPIIAKMLSNGESVSPILGNSSPGSPFTGPNESWSANGQRVTKRCS